MKRLLILGIIACFGLIFTIAFAEQPKKVEVVNTYPIKVVSSSAAPVNVVDVSETPRVVELANTEPIPVTGTLYQDEISNITTLRPGGRTIAGPGCHDFATAEEKINHSFFRVFQGSVMACTTIQNTGGTGLTQISPTQGYIPVDSTDTFCRRYDSDVWVKVETLIPGSGSFCWRVDLLDVVNVD